MSDYSKADVLVLRCSGLHIRLKSWGNISHPAESLTTGQLHISMWLRDAWSWFIRKNIVSSQPEKEVKINTLNRTSLRFFLLLIPPLPGLYNSYSLRKTQQEQFWEVFRSRQCYKTCKLWAQTIIFQAALLKDHLCSSNVVGCDSCNSRLLCSMVTARELDMTFSLFFLTLWHW